MRSRLNDQTSLPELETNMVALTVVVGIVVLASLVVLSAVVMAGRADENGYGLTGEPAAPESGKNRSSAMGRGQLPAAGVNFIQVEGDEQERTRQGRHRRS